MTVILELQNAGSAPVAQVGGKAKNLGRLLEMECPVPPGFCITSDACLEFLSHNQFEPATLTEAVALQGRIPDELDRTIRAAYQAMGDDVAVSVRSSGASEDGGEQSHAGQFETYLNLSGADAVVEHVQRCWSSAFTERVQAYAGPADVRIAVVVQQMAPALKAGIAFTRNPVPGGRQGMVVEAAWGLGETVVSGLVSPDCYYLEPEQGGILEQRIAHKTVQLLPGQSEIQPVPEDRQDIPALTESELRELWEVLVRIQAGYGGVPQDVEWAITPEGCRILQARPITTLEETVDIPKGNWTRAIIEDLWQEILTPLTASVFVDTLSHEYAFQNIFRKLGLRPLVRSDMVALIDHYLYLNAGAVEEFLKMFPRLLTPGPVLEMAPEEARERVRIAPRKWWRLVEAVWRLPWLLTAESYARPWAHYQKVRGKLFPKFEREMAAMEARIQSAGSSDELLYLLQPLEKQASNTLRVNQYSYFYAYLHMWLLKFMTWSLMPEEPAAMMRLLSVQAANKVSETNAALHHLVELVALDPNLDDLFATGDTAHIWERLHRNAQWEPFLEKLSNFMKAYGCRSSSRDFSAPRWREQPTHVLELIRQNLAQIEKTSENPQAQAEEMEARLTASLAGWKQSLLLPVFRRILQNTRQYIALREDLRFNLDRILTAYRAVYLKLGDQLHQQDVVSHPVDIFFLTDHEVRSALAGGSGAAEVLQDIVEGRRKSYQQAEKRRPPHFYVDGRGMPKEMPDSGETEGLFGLGASAGIYQGRVRVLGGTEEFALLQPGEVLVAATTDPGWTPLFRTAGAVVTEIGGLLNHSAVIAREYGIPAVVGVPNVTDTLNTGDIVTVDGSAGRIIIEDYCTGEATAAEAD